jgi:hypothetical protein
MTCYDKMLARRQERDRLAENIVFGTLIFVALVYFGAHWLAAVQLGRWPG